MLFFGSMKLFFRLHYDRSQESCFVSKPSPKLFFAQRFRVVGKKRLLSSTGTISTVSMARRPVRPLRSCPGEPFIDTVESNDHITHDPLEPFFIQSWAGCLRRHGQGDGRHKTACPLRGRLKQYKRRHKRRPVVLLAELLLDQERQKRIEGHCAAAAAI